MYLPHVVVLTRPLQKGAGKKIVEQRRQATRSLWCLGAILERWMGCEGTTQNLTSTETLQHWSLHLTKGVFFKEPECHSPTPCDHITPSPVQDMVRSSSSWSRSPNTHCRGKELFIPTDCVVGAQHLGLDVKIHIQTPEDATWFCTAALLTIQPPWIVDSPVVVPRVLQSCCEVCLSCAAEQPCSTICCLQLHRSSPQAARHWALNPVLYVPVTRRTKAKAISHMCSSSLPLSPTAWCSSDRTAKEHVADWGDEPSDLW